MTYNEKLLKDAGTDFEKRAKRLIRGLFWCFPFTLLLGLGAIPMIIISIKHNRLSILINLKERIRKNDKLRLDSISVSCVTDKDTTIKIINRLIETGHLSEYEIIGDVGIAKKQLGAVEKDFKVIPQFTQVIINEREPLRTCPQCGAAVTKDNRNYCSFCGTLLN